MMSATFSPMEEQIIKQALEVPSSKWQTLPSVGEILTGKKQAPSFSPHYCRLAKDAFEKFQSILDTHKNGPIIVFYEKWS